MAIQPGQGVENNFTKGLITEASGLNFPENAATDCDNVTFTLVGEVTRRFGIDYEVNHSFNLSDRTNKAVATFRWTNAGGDGNNQVYVVQNGEVIKFFSISDATENLPISANLLPGTVTLSNFAVSGITIDQSLECEFTAGNGYLFVFHPNCSPLYCTYVPSTGVVASPIQVKIRDFGGVPEAVDVNVRPTTLSTVHSYNLANQGWTTRPSWNALSALHNINSTGSHTFNIGTVAGINLGDNVILKSAAQYYYPGGPVIYPDSYAAASGTVTAYVDPNITINITNFYPNPSVGSFQYYMSQTNLGFVDTWFTSQGNYPSNADVWWYFKNASGVFDPTTQANRTLATGNAPQGHFIVDAFNIDRAAASGLALTSVATLKRPATGCWFQGRVWYAGVNDSVQPSAEQPFYTWSENLYFSQVNVGTATNFGNCYQTNDPTSENLFDLLPTDGGVVQIQGSGRIFKLFPIQNGLLVFAANGVWFITGSQGIGFSANDYTITKLSSVTSLSSTSFVDVMGLPYFWNEDGIYNVSPQQGGGLAVQSVTFDSIASFYDEIPMESRLYARGAYNPVDKVIQWLYRDGVSADVTERYSFNRILCYNTVNKAWYPWSVSDDLEISTLNSIQYVHDVGDGDSIISGFKYLASFLSGVSFAESFADERDEDYVDWASRTPTDYESFFITGYKLRGRAMSKFQNQYVRVYNRTYSEPYAYQLQGLWDFANSGDTGRWSAKQTVFRNAAKYDVMQYQHKVRGHGLALQFKINSITGMPFNIIGWATVDTIEQGA